MKWERWWGVLEGTYQTDPDFPDKTIALSFYAGGALVPDHCSNAGPLSYLQSQGRRMSLARQSHYGE